MKDLKYIFIIILMAISIIFIYNHYQNKISKINKEHILKYDKMVKISDTQSRKLIADSLTKREMGRIIDSLNIKGVNNPKIVIIKDIKVKDLSKKTDTVVIDNHDVYISDYYPSKDKPFINYIYKDSIGTFKFYPVKIALSISERPDGIWQVDTSLPEYFEITDIKAVSRPIKISKKNKPFYIGGGANFDKNGKISYEVLGGISIKNIVILGGINTNSEKTVKALYNF